MPAAVGAGSFWTGMTDWITGKSTQETLDFIEQSGRRPDGHLALGGRPDTGRPPGTPAPHSPDQRTSRQDSADSLAGGSVIVTTPEKFFQMFLAIAAFVGFFAVLLFVVSRVRGRAQEPLTAAAFIVPTFVMLAVGLIYPAVLTIKQSFQNADSTTFVGLENYATLFTEPEYQRVLVQHGDLGAAGTPRGDNDRADLRSPGRPDPDRVVLQGTGVHPDGDLHGRRLHHLEVRLRLPADPGDRRSAWPTRSSSRWGWTPTSSCSPNRGTPSSSSS